MKTFSLSLALGAAALGLTGCPGNATNTTVNVNTSRMNSNTAVVVENSNTTMNSNLGNSMGNMANSMSNMANAAGNAMSDATTPNGFMTAAAYGGNAEIASSKMALEKTKNPEVKQFAQQMISDHTMANKQLTELAGKKNFTPPTDLDAEHQRMASDLSKLSGDEFDREYMKGQVADHEKTVALFETQANSGTDADAKAFAAKTLPKLKQHLEMAQKLNGKMK